MLLLGIDFETTAIEVDDPGFRVIEVGLATWDTVTRSVVECYSTVIRADMIPIKISGLTGIYSTMTQRYGDENAEHILTYPYAYMLQHSDMLVAHNHFFEKKILNHLEVSCYDLDWVDTMTDIMYPDWMGARNLVQLASLHRIMNPSPHRALNDVLVMFELLGRYNFDDVLAVATTPFVHVTAKVSYDDRNLAKNRRFHWDPSNKTWYKRIRMALLDQERKEYEFPIEIGAIND